MLMLMLLLLLRLWFLGESDKEGFGQEVFDSLVRIFERVSEVIGIVRRGFEEGLVCGNWDGEVARDYLV